jgi:hypothetical protein
LQNLSQPPSHRRPKTQKNRKKRGKPLFFWKLRLQSSSSSHSVHFKITREVSTTQGAAAGEKESTQIKIQLSGGNLTRLKRRLELEKKSS